MPNTAVCAASNTLSVALIVPDAGRRRLLATALVGSQISIVSEFGVYPSPDDLATIARLKCDVVIVDLDDHLDLAIRAIENCSRNLLVTVMAYSAGNDSMLMHRSMQAGAREFLVEPLLPEAVNDAFARASSRRSSHEKVGKILVITPAKGGVGVTTIALNFALALRSESGARVVIVDLDYQLGEIALGLGMTATFSVVDALLNPARLDKEFLSTLLLRHSSGLAVLACPEEYDFFHSPREGAGKLFQILREEFDYVVVDAGTCHSHIQETLFDIADTLYLVTEMSFPALRNSHRLIAFLTARDGIRSLEIVLNRFNSRHGEIDEQSALKVLAPRPITWRIPNAFSAARTAQDIGIPPFTEDTPITRAIIQMARGACGKPLRIGGQTRKGFSFFGLNSLPEPVNT